MGSRRRKRNEKHHHQSLGPIICPKCGEKGSFNAYAIENLTTHRKRGPYFYIRHRDGKHMVSKKTVDGRIVSFLSREGLWCSLGKLTLQELDHLLKQRPWPLNAGDVWEKITAMGKEAEAGDCCHLHRDPSFLAAGEGFPQKGPLQDVRRNGLTQHRRRSGPP